MAPSCSGIMIATTFESEGSPRHVTEYKVVSEKSPMIAKLTASRDVCVSTGSDTKDNSRARP